MNYETWGEYELHPDIAQEFSNEMYETDLANELLNTQTEAELDQFLGRIASTAWRGAKALYNSPAGQALKGQVVSGVKSLGRRALPALGNKIGGYFGGSTGANLGQRAGSWLSNRYLNEYEDEMEYEALLSAARGIVRTARQASALIGQRAQSGQPLNRQGVRGILMQVARQHIPNLASGTSNEQADDGLGGGDTPAYTQSSGSWYRQGNQIIISGVV